MVNESAKRASVKAATDVRWLDAALGSGEGDKPVLVLCRTATSANLVRRFLAGQGGRLGVDVLTPQGLAHLVAGGGGATPASDDVVIPEGHPWRNVTDRPGLLGILQGHLSDIRLSSVDPARLPSTVPPLLEAGLGQDDLTVALASLAELARSRGATLSGEHEYGDAYALGFGNGADLAAPPVRSTYFAGLLASLGARRLAAPVVRSVAEIPATVVTDPSAEARWVAERAAAWSKEAGRDLAEVLVLAANRDAANRIRAALGRSGLPAADDDARPFSEHGLVPLVRRLLPWFQATSLDEVLLEAEALRRLFTSPLVSSAVKLDEAKNAVVRARLAAMEADAEKQTTDEDLFLSRRSVPQALIACRLVRATVGDWTTALERVAEDVEQKAATRRAAVLLSVRLGDLVTSHGPTLGHLQGFLLALGVARSGGRDPIARAILAALRDGRQRPATEADLADVLAGAVGSGVVHRGIAILPYAAYDGRPAGLCLLTGLHAKGLGAAPAPDPFFTDAEMALWDREGSAAHHQFMRRQALAACARAETYLGVVTRRDATGRAVAPAVGLALRFEAQADEAPAIRNYGLAGCTAPEASNLAALEVVRECWPDGARVQGGDAVVEAAALAASVEWVRAGSGRAVDPEQPGETLVDVLDRLEDALPEDLRPWLGDARSIPGAALKRSTLLSATGAFQPLTHCLFQSLLKVRLRLREADAIEEELNAREVGTAIHEALEHVGLDVRWRVASEAEAIVAKAALKASIAGALDDQMKGLDAKRAVATEGVKQARKGVAGRWQKHLDAYVDGRVKVVEDAASSGGAEACSKAKGLPEAVELLSSLKDSLSVDSHWSPARQWFDVLVTRPDLRSQATAPSTFDVAFSKKQPARDAIAAWYDAHRAWADERIRVVGDAYARAIPFESARAGAFTGQGAIEWGFGSKRRDAGPREFVLPLGPAADVSVIGAVDRIRVSSDGAGTAIELSDYKTGKVKSKLAFAKEMQANVLPQLPLYALVLRHALDTAAGPSGVPVSEHPFVLAYDYVQGASTRKGWLEHDPGVDHADLNARAVVLGTLVERARSGSYLLLPHGLTCPVLQDKGHDYCPFAEACRFRRWPGTPLVDEVEPDDKATSSEEGGQE